MSGFDWVTAVKNCSLGLVFEQLKLEIGEDVKTRDGLLPPEPAYGFRIASQGRQFSVLLEGNQLHRSVVFSLEEKAIRIHDDGRTLFEVTVSVNREGRCAMFVAGEEQESWHVRKRALESLFFSL